jgi:hypothetical protein
MPDPAELEKAKAEARRFAAVTAQAKRNRARWMWNQRRPINGSLAETYLRDARCYGGPLPATIGFLPARGEHGPAMISAFGMPVETETGSISISTDQVDGVHLTRLAPDGSGKAGTNADKIMIGCPRGAPIALAPFNDLLGLAITEGIEDGLSVAEATGMATWAAGSASFMPALATAVPVWVECMTILVDDDQAGRRNAYDLAKNLEDRGVELRLITPRAIGSLAA